MRARALVSLAVLAALTAGAPVGAYHANDCSTKGLPQITEPVSNHEIANGQIQHFALTVPDGTQGLVHVQPLNGDVDISICKGRDHICLGTNMYPVGDGCHAEELTIPGDPIFTGDLIEWGPPLEPGTWKLSVQHCFSSEDEGSCDYAPLDDGALDDLPAIQYVIGFTTN